MILHEIFAKMAENTTPKDGNVGHALKGVLYKGGSVSMITSDINAAIFITPELFTLAPRTHTVNGFVVPMAMEVEPNHGDMFYTPTLTDAKLYFCEYWYNETRDNRAFKRKLCFTTEEAAQQNALAMLGLDPALGVDGV